MRPHTHTLSGLGLVLIMLGTWCIPTKLVQAQVAPPTGEPAPLQGSTPVQGIVPGGPDDPAAAEAALSQEEMEASVAAGRKTGLSQGGTATGAQAPGGGSTRGPGSGGDASHPGPPGSKGGGGGGTTIDPLTPLDMAQKVWKKPVAAPGQVSPGSRLYYWEPYKIFTVNARTMQMTAIYLPKCEKIVDIATADSTTFYIAWSRMPTPARARFVPVPSGLDQINLVPKCSGCDNNVQITGESGRTYAFHIESGVLDGPQVSDLQVFVEDPTFCAERLGSVRTSTPTRGSGPGWWQPGGDAGSGTVDGAMPTGFTRAEMPVAGDVPDDDRMAFDRYDVVARSDLAWSRIGPRRVGFDGRHVYLDFSHQSVPYLPTVREIRDDIEAPVAVEIVGARHDVIRVTSTDDLILRAGDDIVCLFRRYKAAKSPAVKVDPELVAPVQETPP